MGSSSLTRDRTPSPLHWERKVLGTGPAGKSWTESLVADPGAGSSMFRHCLRIGLPFPLAKSFKWNNTRSSNMSVCRTSLCWSKHHFQNLVFLQTQVLRHWKGLNHTFFLIQAPNKLRMGQRTKKETSPYSSPLLCVHLISENWLLPVINGTSGLDRTCHVKGTLD